MSTKATEKIIDAITQLVEGFAELQERLEEDYDPEVAEDSNETESDEEEEASSIEEALVTEVRAAVEAVIENEDCAPEDLASIVSALSNALEEIDPEVFSHGTVAEEDEDEDEDEDLDEDDIDLDDEDYDEDEEEEDDDDEDEDEEEEEEEEEEDDDDD